MAKKDSTWITTLADVLLWSQIRGNISPRIVSSTNDEIRIEVENHSDKIVLDAYLVVRFPEGLPLNVESNDSRVLLRRAENRDEVHIEMGPLDSGTSTFTLFWNN